ncbi:hypothetical protein BTM36_04530 [Herbaspirillum sp. VT-16-41]|nr:hypothetical protein BTM36_04530 [Herbaspirillum sp. VT-16-41]
MRLETVEDARAAAIEFADKHNQDHAAVVKLALSWFKHSQVTESWKEAVTAQALNERLLKAFFVEE